MKGYFESNGSLPNLIRPRSFNEKLIARSLRDRRPLLVATADKAAVRDYVRERVGGHILTDVLYIGPDLDECRLSSIAEPVVIKATHASGPEWMRVVTDPTAADWEEIRAAAERWVMRPYQSGNHEWWYEHIPRQVMVERFIGDPASGLPHDYKFFVINQEVELIQFNTDRGNELKVDLYTPTWERIHVTYGHASGPESVPPPSNLKTMIEVATRLSVDLDFVRVDLYDTEAGVKFGELTHCPTAGYTGFSDPAFDKSLASKVPLVPIPLPGSPRA